MHLHLLLGPNSVGKTARSVALAHETGAPVVVLNRFEIYPDLATGCGRPSQAELGQTVRLYVQERSICDGELDPKMANDLLARLIADLEGRHKLVILEGGSVSLCEEMLRADWLRRCSVTVERISLPALPQYRERIRRRVDQMLSPPAGRQSLFEELATAERDPRAYAFVSRIDGYDVVADWCRRRGLSARDAVMQRIDRQGRDEIATNVAASFERYGQQQDVVFARIANYLLEMGDNA